MVTVDSGGTLNLTGNSLIDPGSLTNSGQINVSGAANAFDDETVTNTGAITVSAGGSLTLEGTTAITNATTVVSSVTHTGAITVDGTGTLTLDDSASVSGGSITVAAASGVLTLNGSSGLFNGTLFNSGTLNADGTNTVDNVTGTGSIQVGDNDTLTLDGSVSETVTFLGGMATSNGGTLVLNDGSGDTDTVSAISTTRGTFTIQGSGVVDSASGDGIDFTASGGTPSYPAIIDIDTGGAITGAARGIAVTQSGAGDVTIGANGNVTGSSGGGIVATDSAAGTGNILIDGTGNVTGTGSTSVGINAQITNAANSGDVTVDQSGDIVGGQYGILALTRGSGDVSVTTAGDVTVATGGNTSGTNYDGISASSFGTGDITVETGSDTIDSSKGGTGIFAINQDSSSFGTVSSTISVTAAGTINSGSADNGNGNPPEGIDAGYTGVSAVGTVTVDNSANITATGGDGIFAFFSGASSAGTVTVDNSGNITANATGGQAIVAEYGGAGIGTLGVTDEAGTQISGGQDGIIAQDGAIVSGNAQATGDGNVTVTVGTNASITGSSRYGIGAFSNGTGSITVTEASGDSITSGATGIAALNQAPTSVNFGASSTISSSITVTASGTITSGSTNNGNGSAPAGIEAGYQASNAVGDVTVDNYSTITAAKGFGIFAFMNGTAAGDVTVNDYAGDITALHSATGASGASNPVGIKATSDGTGSITVNTSAGTDINAGSDGILAKNQSTSIPEGSGSEVSVTAHGTIESGTIANKDGSLPAGIIASYGGTSGTGNAVNPSVYGDVIVDNYANITAASGAGGGDGIRAADYGVGNVTVTDETSTTITAGAEYGIDAENFQSGNITIGMSPTGDSISSGSSAIRALNLATTTGTIAGSIEVTAYGTITAGGTADGKFASLSPAGILAGYLGAGTTGTPTAEAGVLGSVVVDNFATVTDSSGDGIEAANYGTGNITIHNEGIGSVAGLIGLSALTAEASDTTTITNDGTLKSSGTSASPVVEIAQSGGSASLDNTGLIEHTGATASAVAISETGGSLAITNTGTIIGVINADASFDNKTDGIWDVAGTNAFDGVTNSVTNAGTINVEGETSFTSSGALTFSNTGTINILSGGIENSNLTNTGHINFNGLGENLDGVIIGNAGSIVVSAGAALTLDDGTTITGGNVTIDGATVSPAALAAMLDVEKGSNSAAPYGATFDGVNVTVSGALDIGNVATGAVLTLDDGTTVTGSGTLTVHVGSALEGSGEIGDGSGLVIDNAGTIEAISGTLTIDDNVTNTGTLEADGGTLSVAGAVTLSGSGGSVLITDGGTADFADTLNEGVAFQGGGNNILELAHSGSLGTVTNFGNGTTGSTGDVIDLQDVAYNSSTEYDVWTQGSGSGTLQIYTAGATPTLDATLTFSGTTTYTQNSFALTGDSFSPTAGTDVVISPLTVTGETATTEFASPTITNEDGHWVVQDGAYTTTLGNVESVVTNGGVGGTTYLLVGDGGYATIQAAIDAATQPNETILVAPGTYTEQDIVDGTHGSSSLTIEGVGGAGAVTVDAPTTLVQTGMSPIERQQHRRHVHGQRRQRCHRLRHHVRWAPIRRRQPFRRWPDQSVADRHLLPQQLRRRHRERHGHGDAGE